jgi:hypothetical protein
VAFLFNKAIILMDEMLHCCYGAIVLWCYGAMVRCCTVACFYLIAGTSFWSKYHLSAKYLGLLKLSSKFLDADFILGPDTRISCISAILIALL